MTDLGALPGGHPSSAFAINDSGWVVGVSEAVIGAVTADQRAFLWHDDNNNGQSDSGEMRDLGTLGGINSAATGINTGGQVVGWAEIDSSRSHAFLWQNGTMIDLGTLGGDASAATAINNNGQVV